MLKTTGLSFQYDNNNQFSFPDIELNTKETLLVLGQSGCGKTTLLHLLAGILKPKGGSIEIKGSDIVKKRGKSLDHFRGQHIGIVFQRHHLLQSLSVRENLEAAIYLSGKAADSTAIDSLLNRLGLAGKADEKVGRLSEGQKQRVSIARALVTKPSLLLADEPSSSLDDKNCMELIHLLEEEAAKAEAALVIVTHDNRIKERFGRVVEL